MNVFIFQSTLERFDLRKAISPQDNNTWYATRYRSAMKPGDTVLFWMAGIEEIRGLYGWGHLTSEPYIKDSWDTYGVDVEYDVKFQNVILATDIKKNKLLSKLLIIRAPQATNFLLSDKEAKEILKLINDSGEIAPDLSEGVV